MTDTTPAPTPADRESAELLPCPLPWCEAEERLGRFGDYSPVVRLHHFGNYRVVCTSCVCEGPLRRTQDEAIAAWNKRPDSLQAEARMSRRREAGIALALSAGKLNVALDGQEKYRRHREAVVRDMEAFAAALNDGGVS